MVRSDFFTNKKMRVTFILSIMVMVMHINVLPHYPMEESIFGEGLLYSEYLIRIFAEIAVPLFFIISGALFYRNYTYKATVKKWKSRIGSLVIPYLVWNSLNMIFLYICSYSFISNYYVGREKIVFSIPNVLKGIFWCEYYGPFWFIRDLIIFTLLCPVIYALVKKRGIGLCVIAVFTIGYFFDIHLPDVIFYRGDAIIYYLLGAYIGVHFFDWFSKRMEKSVKNAVLVLGGIIVPFAVYVYLRGVNETLAYSAAPFFVIVMSLCFWRLFDLFKCGGYYAFERESFLIYAMHQNALAVVSKLFFLVLPVNVWAAGVNYVLTLFVSILSIYAFAYVVERYFPGVKCFITGRK